MNKEIGLEYRWNCDGNRDRLILAVLQIWGALPELAQQREVFRVESQIFTPSRMKRYLPSNFFK